MLICKWFDDFNNNYSLHLCISVIRLMEWFTQYLTGSSWHMRMLPSFHTWETEFGILLFHVAYRWQSWNSDTHLLTQGQCFFHYVIVPNVLNIGEFHSFLLCTGHIWKMLCSCQEGHWEMSLVVEEWVQVLILTFITCGDNNSTYLIGFM